MKKISIIQSNYIPWKGYFDIIFNSDVFIFLDDVQFTKNDWRNRNVIKTSKGLEWMTIPVRLSGKFGQRISETEVVNNRWITKHLQTIKQNYSKSPFFSSFFPKLESTYLSLNKIKSISEINQTLIDFLCKELAFNTSLRQSTDYFSLQELDSLSSVERIIALCKKEDAQAYISGPAAKNYIAIDEFLKNDILLFWANYSNYPVYPQLYETFEHGVSIIDLLFNTGPQAREFLKASSFLIPEDNH